jgi:hypothetical protein
MAETLSHETEIAKIDTRFYSFQGAWGKHQAILVDTQTGREYEIMTRGHLTAPDYITIPVSQEQIEATATRIAGWNPATAGGEKPMYHARQCFHRGLGYSPVHI